MFAQVVKMEGFTETIDAGIAQFKAGTLRAMQDQPGYRGAYLLIDRSTGSSMVVSLWDSEADLRATDEAAARFVARCAEIRAGTPTREEYEVAVCDSPA